MREVVVLCDNPEHVHERAVILTSALETVLEVTLVLVHPRKEDLSDTSISLLARTPANTAVLIYFLHNRWLKSASALEGDEKVIMGVVHTLKGAIEKGDEISNAPGFYAGEKDVLLLTSKTTREHIFDFLRRLIKEAK